MGITLHYKFMCNTKKCARNIVDSTVNLCNALKKGGLSDISYDLDDPLKLSIQVNENAEPISLRFYKYNDKYRAEGYTKTNGIIPEHIIACELLEPAKKIANRKEIRDEGYYCGDKDKKNVGDLLDSTEEYARRFFKKRDIITDKDFVSWFDYQESNR